MALHRSSDAYRVARAGRIHTSYNNVRFVAGLFLSMRSNKKKEKISNHTRRGNGKKRDARRVKRRKKNKTSVSNLVHFHVLKKKHEHEEEHK